jgi:hypothetical protein
MDHFARLDVSVKQTSIAEFSPNRKDPGIYCSET